MAPEDIDIEVWDTDAIPFDSGVAGSRATRINTMVAYEAAQHLKLRLVELAARHLSCEPDVLVFEGDRIRRTDQNDSVGWRDLVHQIGEPIEGRAHIEASGRSTITSFAAQVAEVSVDPETGV